MKTLEPGTPDFDTLALSLARAKNTKRAFAFHAGTRASALRWQKALREKLVGLMGGFPERSPLASRRVERRDFGHYVRETVVFTSRPGVTVFAYFLLPPGAGRGLPCILCFHGHGRGVDSCVGIGKKGEMRPWGKWGEYQHDFALQCVSRGYAVLAIEQMGFGRRRDPASVGRGAADSSCMPAAGAGLLLGETMAAWRTWDAIRGVDYLRTRREVDAARVAVMGISGGGMTAFLSAAVDERISAAMVSGYFNTFRDSVLSIRHCIDNYIPGILLNAEMSDIAGLIAPRSLFVESGATDPIFPVQAARAAFIEARRIYTVLGAEGNIGIEVFNAGHRFWGKKAFPFLGEHL